MANVIIRNGLKFGGSASGGGSRTNVGVEADTDGIAKVMVDEVAVGPGLATTDYVDNKVATAEGDSEAIRDLDTRLTAVEEAQSAGQGTDLLTKVEIENDSLMATYTKSGTKNLGTVVGMTYKPVGNVTNGKITFEPVSATEGGESISVDVSALKGADGKAGVAAHVGLFANEACTVPYTTTSDHCYVATWEGDGAKKVSVDLMSNIQLIADALEKIMTTKIV